MNKKFLLLSITGLFLLSACVGDQQIMVTEYDDEEKNCSQLKFELSNLGVQFQDAKDDSGLTGKNVALGLFFWPGIIVNERQAKANSKSVNDRITHLNRIYSKKCIKDKDE